MSIITQHPNWKTTVHLSLYSLYSITIVSKLVTLEYVIFCVVMLLPLGAWGHDHDTCYVEFVSISFTLVTGTELRVTVHTSIGRFHEYFA